MKEYTTEQLRNVALVGHQGAGKTSLVEAMLFSTGAINRLGSVQEGTTVADWDEEEKERQLSINTSVVPCEVNNVKVNLLDTPGFADFLGEVKGALHIADSVAVVIDAVSGVEVGTELTWEYAEEYGLPRVVVINKMDRDNARWDRALENLSARFPDFRFVPVQLPIGEELSFKGIVDLLSGKAFMGDGKNAEDAPADMADAIEEARLELIEAAAEADEELMEKYFEEETLSPEEIIKGLRAAVMEGTSIPVFVTASTANVGVTPLLKHLAQLMPDPNQREFELSDGTVVSAESDHPATAYVFRTTADKFVGTLSYFRVLTGTMQSDTRYQNVNKDEQERFGSLLVMQGSEQNDVENLHAGDIGAVAKLGDTTTGDTLVAEGDLYLPRPTYSAPIFAVAVTPRSQSDATKMGSVLTSLTNSDLTLRWHQEPSTNQTILEGNGDVHISVAIKKAEALGVNLDTAVPKVPYRETVTRSAESQHRHKKQTGGAGQFAEVHLRITPRPRDGEVEDELEFVNEVVGGAISQSFMPSIEKGIRAVMQDGVVAGYPVVRVECAVYDGKEHPVDSKDIAFQVAGREVFKKAFMSAGPVILEPIMNVKIIVPDENMGDIMGDLSTRRGRVQGSESELGKSIITATAPLAEMQRYVNDLRSMTGGRGIFEMEFSHYDVVPSHLAQEIVAKHQAELEEEA